MNNIQSKNYQEQLKNQPLKYLNEAIESVEILLDIHKDDLNYFHRIERDEDYIGHFDKPDGRQTSLVNKYVTKIENQDFDKHTGLSEVYSGNKGTRYKTNYKIDLADDTAWKTRIRKNAEDNPNLAEPELSHPELALQIGIIICSNKTNQFTLCIEGAPYLGYNTELVKHHSMIVPKIRKRLLPYIHTFSD